MEEPRNDIAWQQGFVLPLERAIELGIISDKAGSDTVVIVITHDCDLLEPPVIEPDCEIILGNKIPTTDGHFTNGKNPRRLHLPFSAGSKPINVELLATKKISIRKEDLLALTPDGEVRLSQDEHFTLQSWLSARYHRAVFPNEFDRRLKAKPAEIH